MLSSQRAAHKPSTSGAVDVEGVAAMAGGQDHRRARSLGEVETSNQVAEPGGVLAHVCVSPRDAGTQPAVRNGTVMFDADR
jgi:hypothetical protein